MKKRGWQRFLRGASIRHDLDEIQELFVRYLKDETLAPLKDVGRFALFGALGSVFVGFGAVLLLLASLRFLQEQFRVLDGSLSWLPYVIVAVLSLVILGVVAWRVVSGTARRRLPKSRS